MRRMTIASAALLSSFALVCLVTMMSGCASRAGGPGLDAIAGAPVGSFSDDISREVIRQTKQLEALKTKDYLVGADDVLEISIFEWEMSDDTKTFLFRVSQSGVILLPVIGQVQASGRSVEDIQKEIEKTLADKNILQNPRVAVAVQDFRSKRIAVIGAVSAPGVYAIHENVSTVMDILTLAGGPSDAAGSVAYVLRSQRGEGDPLKIAVDLEDLLDRGDYSLNAVMRGGDVVYVPKAPMIYVYGQVNQPGGFPLRRSTSALEAIALAGGMKSDASSDCRLVRRTDGGGRTSADFDVDDMAKGQSANLYLREGDVIYVPESIPLVRALWDVVTGIFTLSYRLN